MSVHVRWALGSIQTLQDSINLMIGILIVAIVGEFVRKTRTSRLTQMTVAPEIRPKEGKM